MVQCGKRLMALILILALVMGMYPCAEADGESDFLKMMLSLSNNETYKATVSQKKTAKEFNTGSYVYTKGEDGSEAFKAVEVIDEDTAQFYFGAKRVKVPKKILFIGTSCSRHGNSLDIIKDTLNSLSFYGNVTYHLESWPGSWNEGTRPGESGVNTFKTRSILQGEKKMDSADWSTSDLTGQTGNRYIQADQRHLTKTEYINGWISDYLTNKEWDYIVFNSDGINDKFLFTCMYNNSDLDYRNDMAGMGTALKNLQKALQDAQEDGTGIIVLTEPGEVSDISEQGRDITVRAYQEVEYGGSWKANLALGYVFTTDLQNETNVTRKNGPDSLVAALNDTKTYGTWEYEIKTKDVLNAVGIADYSDISKVKAALRSNIEEEYDLVIDGMSDVTWLSEEHLKTLKFYYYDNTDGWKVATEGTDYKCAYKDKQLKVTTLPASDVIRNHEIFYITVQSGLDGKKEKFDGEAVETNTTCSIDGKTVESPTVLLKHFKVEYETDADPKYGKPADEKVPKDARYLPNASVVVETDLTTTQTYAYDSSKGENIPGTWEFTPWENNQGITITNNTFTITKDTLFEGAWKFNPETYEVNYVVKGDQTWGIPEDSTTPEDPTDYIYKDPVVVKAKPTSTQTYAFNAAGEKIPGTWEFGDWDHTDFNITEDTTIMGSWKFTPGTYKVDYVVNGDPDWGIPDDSVTPEDPTKYDYKDPVVIKAKPTSTQTYAFNAAGEQVPGKWEFGDWDHNDFNITEDTTVTGGWKFIPDTYKVDYEWIGDVPPNVTIPTDTATYSWHDNPDADPIYTDTTSITGTKDGVPGTYKFSGWDNSEDPNMTKDGMEGDITFKGVWKFIPDDYKVDYEWTGDVPPNVTIPTDTATYSWHDDPDADPTYTDTTSITGTKDGVPGTYKFSGWDNSEDPNMTKDGMEGDITFKGVWKFIPDDYKVDYEWTGDVPPNVTIPTDTATYSWHDDPDADPEYDSNTLIPGDKDGVPGVYKFSGWDDSEDPNMTKDGMEGDITFKGTWTFIPNTYMVDYVVNGDPEWGTPEDSVTPEDPTVYSYNDNVIVKAKLTSTQTYAINSAGEQIPGTWEFGNWDHKDFQITENTTITGSWKFIPADQVKVTYVTEEDPVYGKPDDETLPADEYYYPGSPVIVKPALTTKQTTAKDPVTGQTVSGTWTFTPWDKQDFTVMTDTEIKGIWTFTPIKTGALEISKTVEGTGADKNQKFTFTVTFSATGSFAYTGTYNGTISSGDSIQLADGESVTITGLPEGTRYAVAEEKVAGYEARSAEMGGTITYGKTQHADFVNTRTELPPTGDPVNPLFLCGLMLLAGIGICITLKKKRA